MLLYRHPEAAQRPSFPDILIPLQKPDFQVLQWSSEELTLYSEEERTLGAALEAGHQLHSDLQIKYLAENSKPELEASEPGSRNIEDGSLREGRFHYLNGVVNDHGYEVLDEQIDSRSPARSHGSLTANDGDISGEKGEKEVVVLC